MEKKALLLNKRKTFFIGVRKWSSQKWIFLFKIHVIQGFTKFQFTSLNAPTFSWMDQYDQLIPLLLLTVTKARSFKSKVLLKNSQKVEEQLGATVSDSVYG